MPPEAPNRIEELLRRFSRERREQAGGFSLHPATRRLLQGEVSRQFGASASEKKSGHTVLAWLLAWRGPAFACLLVMLLGGGIWYVTQKDHQAATVDFAKLDRPAMPADQRALVRRDGVDRDVAEKPATLSKAAEAPNTSRGFGRNEQGVTRELRALKTGAPAENAEPSGAVQQKVQLAAASAEPASVVNGPIVAAKEYESLGARQQTANLADAKDERMGRESKDKAGTELPKLELSKGGAVGGGALSYNQAQALNNQSQPYGQAGVAAGNNAQALNGGSAGVAQNSAFQDGASYYFRKPGTAEPAAPAATQPQQGGNAYGNVYSANAVGQQAQLAVALPSAPAVQKQLSEISVASSVSAGRAAGDQAQGGAIVVSDKFALDDSPTELRRRNDAAPVVLNNFTLEQNGTNVRVIDADDSVYNGTVVADSGKAEMSRLKRGDVQQTDALAETLASGNRVNFVVSGTNVTLRQRVVVNGNYSPLQMRRFIVNGQAVSEADTLARARGVAAQVIPPASSVPAATPLARVTSPATSPSAAPDTNAPSVEGTLRVGSAPERSFRAYRARGQ